MQKSPSPHTPFFTSLKNLEKRLKLENHPAGPSTLSPPPPPPPPPIIQHQETINNTQQTDSLGTPIYLTYNQSPTTNTNPSCLQESEAPPEFLSASPDFPPTNHSLPREAEVEERVDQPERLSLDDDIELLMQLLRLSDSEELNARARDTTDIGCDDGFYDKIVRVKGPKSEKELERLGRWIKHFLKGEKKEPFRLAHLLLGRAAFVHSDDDYDGFGGLVFPSTIDEFLQNEPPID